MIKFVNSQFDINEVKKTDIFICAFGYERRSMSLFYKMRKVILPNNIHVFVFDDYKKYQYMISPIEDVIKEIDAVIVGYDSNIEVAENIKKIVSLKKTLDDNIVVHIDYSSMPRQWYCELPFLLRKSMDNRDKLYFWYVAGEYPGDYEAYPCAGIDSFWNVIGKTSLRTAMRRVHVLGIGYDTVRTSAMLSILDPDSYIVCCAYNKENEKIGDNVQQANEQIISGAYMSIAFQIDDFSYMIAKLCEVANEFLPMGDVILVPDGPKPLIFAMSLIPQILKKPGITCLQVSRNKECYMPIDVKATDNIYGFSVKEVL